MTATTIDISKEQRKIVAGAGYTLKGVFNRGFQKLFIDPQTPYDKKIEKLQQESEMFRRLAQKLHLRVLELENKEEKRSVKK